MHLASELLADVRRRAMLPATSTSTGFADSDLLAHADAEMARLASLMLTVNEEFFVTYADIPLVSGQSAYRLPERNMGGRVRDVMLVQGATQFRLARLEPELLARFLTTGSGFPQAFYMDAGSINVVPTPSAGAYLRVRFYVAPSKLTQTAGDWKRIDAGTQYTTAPNGITGATGSTLWVDCASKTTFAALYASLSASERKTLDVVSCRSPHEFLALDAIPDPAITSGDFDWALQSFDAEMGAIGVAWYVPANYVPLSTSISDGDFVCLSGYSPVIQLPDEMYSLLVQSVTCDVLEQLNYTEKYALAKQRQHEMEAEALKLITPRTDGSPKKMRGLLTGMSRLGVFR